MVGADPTPFRAGTLRRSETMNNRDLLITILTQGATKAAAEASLETLINHLAGTLGRDAPREGILTVTQQGGALRALRATVPEGLSKEAAGFIPRLEAFLMPVRFLATHPTWYDPAEQTETAIHCETSISALPVTYRSLGYSRVFQRT